MSRANLSSVTAGAFASSRLPTVLSPDPSGIPRDLVTRDRWVTWRLEPVKGAPDRLTKVPYAVGNTRRRADVTSPKAWSSLDRAHMAWQGDSSPSPLSGIGFVLCGDGVGSFDLDHAIDERDRPYPWAQEFVDRLPGAHVELSPSGRGLRGFFLGVLPPWGRKTRRRGGVIELYDNLRFMTVTGHALRPVDKLLPIQADLEALHAELFPSVGGYRGETFDTQLMGQSAAVDPEDLRLLDAMFSGRGGDRLQRIWSGDYQDYDGDESGAELALANALAFYTAKNPLRMERIIRAGPWRLKWDERRGTTTYLGLTIAKAVEDTKEVWMPGYAATYSAVMGRAQCAVGDTTMPDDRIRQLEQELDLERRLRAEDRRRDEVERKLLALAEFNLGQKQTIITVARILGAYLSQGEMSPIVDYGEITRKLACDRTTVYRNLKVFDIPGSPIRRELLKKRDRRADGTYGPKSRVRFHCSGVTNGIDVIEKLIEVGSAVGLAPGLEPVSGKTCRQPTGLSPVDDTKVLHSAHTDDASDHPSPWAA